ncbi:LppP/LprE family lipoprotein [Mycolicibacterium sp. XJ1819]
MRTIAMSAALLMLGLTAACGWSPPSAPPTTAVACAPADGPDAGTVAAEIDRLPAAQWREASRGHTPDCSLHWVQVVSGDASDSPQQVLFFDRGSPVGTPTPDPRPYLTVTTVGDDTVAVGYQWRQGDEPACCPTGVGSARFQVDNGELKALDPIPGP